MKKQFLLFTVVIIFSAAISGCYLLPEEEDVLDPPLIEAVDVTYVTETVELSDITQLVYLQGSFRPLKEYTLSFEQRGGIILEKYCKMRQEVNKDDLLLELDIEDMEQEKQLAFLYYEKARITYEYQERRGSTYSEEMARLDMEIAKLNYDQITKQIEEAKLISPIDGTITYLTDKDVGEYITAKANVIKIADTSEFRLIVEGDDASELSFGDVVDVEITIDRKTYTYKGEVVLSPYDKPENMDETFEEPTAIIEVSGISHDDITINLAAKIIKTEDSRENVIVIRKSYINNYFGRTFVYILEDGVKVERDVEKGLSNSTHVEIISGLEVGDEIIIR